MTIDLRRIALAVIAPLLAIVFSLVVTALVLVATGDPVWSTAKAVLDYGTKPNVLALTLNQGTVYYLSALAVAIGFRMNLFNIGVDGQYRLAAFTAAVVGSSISLPKPLHILVIVVTAMLVGAMWAGIAAVLKATRGVSEVISTIMLNAIATTLIAYLLRKVKYDVAGSNNIGTKPIDESGAFPGIDLVPGTDVKVFGFIFVAIIAGILYTVVLGRTRFGFDLRAAGASESAAIASGVNVKKMIVIAMLLSGAVAGLVGLPTMFSDSFAYGSSFQTGLGFTGIAVALLGRNTAIGTGLAALLFGALFTGTSTRNLDPDIFQPELASNLTLLIQGLVVLFVGVDLAVLWLLGRLRRKGTATA